MSNIAEATAHMLTTYHELNGGIHVLYEEPSPLDFMRYVTKNRPLLVRRGCSKWLAVRRWNVDYLGKLIQDTPIKIAITPYGLVQWKRIGADTYICYSNADSATRSPVDSLTYFVKPFELVCIFSNQIDYVTNQFTGCNACMPLECLVARICNSEDSDSEIVVGRAVLYFSHLLTDFERSDDTAGGQILASAYGLVRDLRGRLLTRLS